MDACKRNHVETARLLLEWGADVSLVDNSKNTALVQCKSEEMRLLLLDPPLPRRTHWTLQVYKTCRRPHMRNVLLVSILSIRRLRDMPPELFLYIFEFLRLCELDGKK
eukprot:m.15790 g.15790  ORF g.15790 m.15790 type:complete len:108 (+) comp9978_c0_seq1:335-658(+)